MRRTLGEEDVEIGYWAAETLEHPNRRTRRKVMNFIGSIVGSFG
jgi:hypothetical protein